MGLFMSRMDEQIIRKIIHVDLDCFYAAVEVLDNPALKGKPVGVGGYPGSNKGVLCTASYEARKFGVRAAMSTFKAKQLCKDLVLVPVNMERYKAISKQIHDIFQRYTDLIEPLSLDEAYLDVTECKLCKGSATLIAHAIRSDIETELHLTASAGIAPNKLIAKVASDLNKPNGQFVVTPGEVDDFMAALPVSKLFGVGKATQGKMASHNITTCQDLQGFQRDQLSHLFGKFGESLYGYCRGIDNRDVEPSRVRKSVSVEQTFESDIPTISKASQVIGQLICELRRRLEKHSDRTIKSTFVKIKFNDFTQTTAEQQGGSLTLDVIDPLFNKAYSRSNKPFRLLGVGVNFSDDDQVGQIEQLGLSLDRVDDKLTSFLRAHDKNLKPGQIKKIDG